MTRALMLTAALFGPLGTGLAAQGADLTSALEQALPGPVSQRVLQHVADARAQGLPAATLAHRALELAAKSVPPALIEQVVAGRVAELSAGRQALWAGGHPDPTDDEVDAAATAMGKGVDAQGVSDLAKAVPSGRSLAVPLLVLSSLVDRGLPSDQALRGVLARLETRTSDRQLEGLGNARALGGVLLPRLTGLDLAATKGPTDVGKPAWVPANSGKANRPVEPIVAPGNGKP